MEKIIEILKYIFLGAIQGITETLPISSSGHLIIMKKLVNLNTPNDLTFEILLHLGSLIAILFFYRKLLGELIVNFFNYIFKKDKHKYVVDFKYVWLIIIATIPAALIGFLFDDFIAEKLTSLLTVGIGLLITATILFLISKMKKGNKDQSQVTFKDAIYIGFIQAIAIMPGISRSGSTVSMSLARKLNIDNALRFSFLLFIPVVFGAALLDFIKLMNDKTLGNIISIPYLLAFLTAILFTYISLQIFIDVLKKGKLSYFSIYCLFAGTLSLVLYFIF